MIQHLSTAAIGAPITRLGVSFFPIYLPENELPEIKTGSSSELVVRELDDAAVGSLLAANPADTPVLIVEGEHFLGGKQNRAVNVTALVPPRTELPIPVSCLERGGGNGAGPTTETSTTLRRESAEGVRRAFTRPWSRADLAAEIKARSGTRSIARCNFTERPLPRRPPPKATGASIAATRAALRPPKSWRTLGRFLVNAGSPSPMAIG